jgi:hypothetical protein
MILEILVVMLWTIVMGAVFFFLGGAMQYTFFKRQLKDGLTPYVASNDNIEWNEKT